MKIELNGFSSLEEKQKAERLMKECFEQLDKLGIKYQTVTSLTCNKRYTARWATCVHKGRNKHDIILAAQLMLADDYHIQNTIMHEVLHTVKGCDNHGELWKRYAKKVNDAYGYNVKRTTSAEEKGLKDKKIERANKYFIGCPCCGRKWGYKSLSKAVKNPENFRCPDCKTSLVRVDENGKQIEVKKRKEAESKYIIGCPECNTEWKYKRICKAVRNPQSYICTGCGQPLMRLDEEYWKDK